MLLNPFTFYTPTTLAEAAKLYADLDRARLKAGGTFLINQLKALKKRGTQTPQHIIGLGKINELKTLTINKQELSLGAMTTVSDLLEAPLDDNFEILKSVACQIGTTPIRNMATVGGNITSRYTWTEFPSILIALEAQLHFVDAQLQENICSAEEFFAADAKTDQILTKIKIKRNKKSSLAYHRVKKSSDLDVPLLAVSLKTIWDKKHFTKTIVSVNTATALVQRDTKLEAFLNQKSCSTKIVSEAIDHLDDKIYDTRSDDYKKQMFRIAIKSALLELITKK